jgi:hypothetical protein
MAIPLCRTGDLALEFHLLAIREDAAAGNSHIFASSVERLAPTG